MSDPTVRLYPRPRRSIPRTERHGRRWKVAYDLYYDGGSATWSGYYRTRTGALIGAWWHVKCESYGGSALLTDTEAAQ